MATTSTHEHANYSSNSYIDYAAMLDPITKAIAGISGPVFTTSADPEALWQSWLAALPAHERQHHTCHECRRFVQRFGGLGTINASGRLTVTGQNTTTEYTIDRWN